ncbi:MAG: hypothetical protein ACI8VW_003026 [bacterium]|jgi:hypothetical protein
MNDIKQQLAPSWSTVNIVISVFLVIVAWPAAIIFIAYVLWGSKIGLDLGRPETLKALGRRLSNAFRAGIEAFTKG